MTRFVSCVLFLLLTQSAWAQDWLQWRGPTGDNHAPAGSTAPVAWSETSNILWKTEVPGRGHSSPTIVGDRIYLTTCDDQAEVQSLLVFDRTNGKLLKKTTVHTGKITKEIHPNNSRATPTVASDGEKVFALFDNDHALWVTAFDFDGNQLWQKRVAGFDPQQYKFGLGPSPIVVGNSLIVTSEYDGPDSGIYAISTADGSQNWKAPRPEGISYSSPIAARLNGRVQLFMSGNKQIASYDPNTGKELWSVEGSAPVTCGTLVWDANTGTVFASGGFPNPFTLGVETRGNPQIVWDNNVKCYEQSMLFVEGYLYAVDDKGIVHCYRGSDGEEMWKKRTKGPVSASPVLIGNAIYYSNELGTTFVFAANPERYEELAKNQLGTDSFPTMTPCDGKLYHRYGSTADQQRQEYLVAIGEE